MKKYMAINKLEPIAKLGKRSYACKMVTPDDDVSVDRLMLTKGVPERDDDITSELVEDLDIDEYRELKFEAAPGKNSVTRVKREQKNLTTLEWHLNNDGLNGLKENADTNANEAWAITRGAGVKVAVIDTGFDLDHPDINYAGIGYDALENKPGASAGAQSVERHGTAVAGIIAAKDDGIGVVGVAPEAQIIPIRLLSDGGGGNVSSIIIAHQKAVELGAQIINNSWGSIGSEDLTQLEKDLYKEIYEEANGGKGVLIVFASGNSRASNLDYAPEARDPSTLAVGATDSSDKRAGYSNYGPGLDLVAPGGDTTKGILTTDRTDIKISKNGKSKLQILGYAKGDTTNTFTGTSAAAPVVAGVAALVLSANPNLTARQVREILNRSAKKLDSYQFDANGINAELGHGRVDAKAAVDLALTY
jgi:subtilisin family serine protease